MKKDLKSKNQKYIFWKNKLSKTADGLGLGIEKGILEACILFNSLGLYTSQSCYGHVNWGVPFPWIDISPINDPKYKKEFFYINKIENYARKKTANYLKDNKIRIEDFKESEKYKYHKLYFQIYGKFIKEKDKKGKYFKYKNFVKRESKNYEKILNKVTENYKSNSQDFKYVYNIYGSKYENIIRISPKKYGEILDWSKFSKKEKSFILKEARKEFKRLIGVIKNEFIK